MVKPIPPEIYGYPMPDDYNETRRGFVDSGFMEEVLSEQGFSPDMVAPVAQFGPRPVNSSLVLADLFTHPIFKKEMIASLEYGVPVISEVEPLDFSKVVGNAVLHGYTRDGDALNGEVSYVLCGAA